MSRLILKVSKMYTDSMLPTRKHKGDAGLDLPVYGNHRFPDDFTIVIPTGLKFEIPEGYYGRIIPRSSTLLNKNIIVQEGIIDSGYRGQVGIVIHTIKPVILQNGESIAQLILCPLTETVIEETQILTESERGENGFGSTGK